MKKLFIILVLSLMFTNVASAHNIYDISNTKVVDVIPDSVWNEAMKQTREVQTLGLPFVVRGHSVTDQTGLTSVCPIWFPSGCSDMTGTSLYKSQMKNLAQELISNGSSKKFPMYAGWYKIVRGY